MTYADYARMRNLFIFGVATMVLLVVVGVYTGNWTVAASGLFSSTLIIFSMRKLMLPVRWLKKVGAPLSFDADARAIQNDLAPLLPWQKPQKRLSDIRYPFAALVASRIRRSDGFSKVYNRAAGLKVEKSLRKGLRFLDEGGFDLEDAAAVGSGYYDALVRQSISAPESPEEVTDLVVLLREGVEADSIVAYAVDLGPKNAMEALRQGIPLELARVLFAPQDDEVLDD